MRNLLALTLLSFLSLNSYSSVIGTQAEISKRNICKQNIESMVISVEEVGLVTALLELAEDEKDIEEYKRLDTIYHSVFTEAELAYAKVKDLSVNKWYLTSLRSESLNQGYNFMMNATEYDVTKINEYVQYIVDNGCQ